MRAPVFVYIIVEFAHAQKAPLEWFSSTPGLGVVPIMLLNEICWLHTWLPGERHSWFNPFTLRVPLESIVCSFYAFENNLGIKGKFAKYLNGSCFMASDKHISFKCFPKNAFI